MNNKFTHFLKQYILLLPTIATVLLCLYFMNLFQRIENVQLSRQIQERNTITEVTRFIDNKKTLFKYLDLMDRFEDNYIYLLDDHLKQIPERYSTPGCPYAINKVKHPFEEKKYSEAILKNDTGYFVHKVNSQLKIDFQYKHLKKENVDYILVVGVTNYPKMLEERELQYAIGIVLIIIAICNWIAISYIKHMRYLCNKNLKK